MELASWAVYTAAEVIFILVVACVLLLLHTKNLKGALSALQRRLSSALADLRALKESQQETQAALEAQTPGFEEQISAKLTETQDYYTSLEGSTKIEEDLLADTPQDRRTAALRHLFLKSEQCYGQTSPPNWEGIQKQLRTLSAVPELPTPPSEPGALSYNEQRDEIERFKRLFTTMETQWQQAKNRAEEYYQQLVGMIGDSSDPKFQALKDLAQSQLKDFDEAAPPALPPSEDINAIKSQMAQQQAEITRLQEQIAKAKSDAERAKLVTELEAQLTQQMRFLKESETCISQLEQELKDVNAKLTKQDRKLKAMAVAPDDPQIAEDKLKLLRKIQQLESENEQLVHLAEHADAELKSQLKVKDDEISAISKKLKDIAQRYKALSNGQPAP
ncbi:hypothetical protein L1F30_10260 [Simiduia sp. 21SJ11W-1]|uniref:hypothetical protein n=1 Tax=Simiduia sp. 21SJ11W-1 TaxID=2909669 RepID=UPI00209CBEC2|nr:hypothetical protein [Simiduia sp. 21SJ11W-1]UTA46553.1 hypothetical protein L1F30_10260 [Simiduia sp. 21SJ11W-1]